MRPPAHHLTYSEREFKKMSILEAALQKISIKGGDSYTEPSEIACVFFDLFPEVIKPFFSTPLGVKNESGEYIGTVIQLAKGGLGRLHGPALEFATREILQALTGLDERDSEERKKNPFVIVYKNKEVKWDVRRYSSSRDDRGRWSQIPDLSYYVDCTQREMREALSKDDAEPEEETKTTTQNSRRNARRR